MATDIKPRITQMVDTIVNGGNGHTQKVIAKSEFDKTYTGRVISRYPEDVSKEQTGWLVYANASTYVIPYDRCYNISQVNQDVKVYIPNNDRTKLYAEAIVLNQHPDKIVFNSDTDTYTNYYNLADKTVREEKYVLTVEHKGEDGEEVTAITFPDGSVMRLEGFVIG